MEWPASIRFNRSGIPKKPARWGILSRSRTTRFLRPCSARYLSLARTTWSACIFGERKANDNEADNVYTRATGYLNDWIAGGMLARDAEPAMFPYFQEFRVPDTGERLTRKGFIALGADGRIFRRKVVHRHEQTLAGPKKDRSELLRHTHAHFGQIFMLYADAAGAVDALLDEAAARPPIAEIQDEYGAIHRVWRMTGADRVRELMADKKLVIADGHTATKPRSLSATRTLECRRADRVMMTFVNMHAPGLKILRDASVGQRSPGWFRPTYCRV